MSEILCVQYQRSQQWGCKVVIKFGCYIIIATKSFTWWITWANNESTSPKTVSQCFVTPWQEIMFKWCTQFRPQIFVNWLLHAIMSHILNHVSHSYNSQPRSSFSFNHSSYISRKPTNCTLNSIHSENIIPTLAAIESASFFKKCSATLRPVMIPWNESYSKRK